MGTIEVIGHRGASSERPENTLPAFLRALELGADAVELDVHGTRDGAIVVHHDPTVPAGSSGGEPRPIADATLAELRRTADGASIPTLDEVLAAVGTRLTVYIEIKGRSIEQPVVDLLRRHPARCAIHAFDHRVPRRSRALAPEIAAGILVHSYLLEPSRVLRQAGARDYWCHWEFVDRDLVEQIHRTGGRVIAWTVNDGRVAQTLAGLGVDGICTDDVAAMRARFPSTRGPA